MTTLIDFLTARLDEDEAVALDSECRCGDGPQRPDCSDRILSEVEVKRDLLFIHQDGATDEHLLPFCSTCRDRSTELSRQDFPCPTIRALGYVYYDHPDYRDEWL